MASREYYRNMSRRLSRVMDDIGVNEEAVMNRRRYILIEENILNLSNHLRQKNETIYNFGSQTECTTTAGLNSDIDIVMVTESFNLIQDLNDWVPGKLNLLMVPNERFPGYCKLQRFKSDEPYPEDGMPSDMFTFDEAGRVKQLNLFGEENVERHGPAEQLYGADGSGPNDFVPAIRCKTWPNGYKMWSRLPRKGTWPTSEMISYMEKSGCFVVQVAHRLNEKKSESWRISTSLAERCLMFSLNITQIRCYIIIKMIVKTFIDPVVPDVISSYICKNLLFHSVEKTRPDFWQESNLLRCVNQILLNMLEAIRCMNYPNYFNESINLLLGRVNKDNQIVLMSVIWKLMISEGGFLAEIRFDNINELIHNYQEAIYQRKDCSHSKKYEDNHALKYEEELYGYLNNVIRNLMLKGRFNQRNLMSLQNILLLFALQGPLQYTSASLLFPFLCSHLATLKASEHILHGEIISSGTSLLYERSLDSDVTSSRLKFASYLYCTGQFEGAMSVLDEVEGRLVDGCIAVCQCDQSSSARLSYTNMDTSLSINCLSPSHVSMCVMFSQDERQCCPRELQFEMYRSTEQERLQMNEYGRDNWMDLACIDSTSYLYFLWYVTSRHQGLQESELPVLERLEELTNVVLGHRETVYNLFGQCYEYENRFNEAFVCYCKSLRVRPTHNAARWHIVLLLYLAYQNE